MAGGAATDETGVNVDALGLHRRVHSSDTEFVNLGPDFDEAGWFWLVWIGLGR